MAAQKNRKPQQNSTAVKTAEKKPANAVEKTSPNYMYEFVKGLLKENPTLVGLLGMCPTLAVTVTVIGSLGMGLATAFVLMCSNIIISLLKNIIPKAVRLPCFIVVIAGFVTLVKFLLGRYVPVLSETLGVYLDLITVNCIILGRAEVFASKNKPIVSALDGLGMGLGFTLALCIMGSLREIIGLGKWAGMTIPGITPVSIVALPAGGFFTLGIIIAVVGIITKKKPPQEVGCHGCPNAANCQGCAAAEGGDK